MEERVGLVLAGAAARGPYQAGALSVLVPALRAAGHEPVVILGTSSGAINAALLAQFADTGDDAGEHVAQVWRDFGPVFANPLASGSALRLLGRSFTDCVGPAAALLDTRPLRDRAQALYQPERVAANVRSGRVRTLAVAATVCPSAGAAARSRLFLMGEGLEEGLEDAAVDVVEVAAMGLAHLLASAAIPMLFTPVHVDEPASVAGWYVDGGVRLNAPLAPAIAAGVTRVVVVAGHSAGPPPQPRPVGPEEPPDIAAGAALSVRAVLADGLADDLQRLGRRNRNHERGYRRVPYLLVAPEDGELARLAAATFSPGHLPTDAYWTIGRILDLLGDGPGRDELLSLVLFAPDYAKAQYELGREHAEGVLARGWRYDPPEAS